MEYRYFVWKNKSATISISVCRFSFPFGRYSHQSPPFHLPPWGERLPGEATARRWSPCLCWCQNDPGISKRVFSRNHTYIIYTYIYIYYIYIPETQMSLVLIGKGPCFGGKTKDKWVPGMWIWTCGVWYCSIYCTYMACVFTDVYLYVL